MKKSLPDYKEARRRTKEEVKVLTDAYIMDNELKKEEENFTVTASDISENTLAEFNNHKKVKFITYLSKLLSIEAFKYSLELKQSSLLIQ